MNQSDQYNLDAVISEVVAEFHGDAVEPTNEVQAEGESPQSDPAPEDSADGAEATTEQTHEGGTEGDPAGSSEESPPVDTSEYDAKISELTAKVQELESRAPPSNETLAQAVYEADDPFAVLAEAGIDADLLFDRMMVAKRGQEADRDLVRDVEFRRKTGQQQRELQRLKHELASREQKQRVDEQVAAYGRDLDKQFAEEKKYPALHLAAKADPEWIKDMAYRVAAESYMKGNPLTADKVAQKLEERFAKITKQVKPAAGKSPAVAARPSTNSTPKKPTGPRTKDEEFKDLQDEVISSILKDLGA